ncbi:MAG: asparagine synthase (glutamine-hydrolyzing) [Nitrospira defluvii]|nr:asparagine synthase (glutamine-hydrolyzing) [Nitrospira defluvii]
MCGITGIVGQHEPVWIDRMNNIMTHRGPDDHGVYRSPDGTVALAMRRLSILDVEGGHQPMGNPDGTIWIVFNGEIFNSPELRAKLEQKGYSFKTRNSDTEVLIHLYADKGQAMLHDLNGMFAFVIYDRRKNILFGARDRMGIKPLYYCQGIGRFAWASEAKALLTLPWVSRNYSSQSLSYYLTLLYVPGDQSIIAEIFRVPPGHSFIYDLSAKQIRLEQYWELDFSRTEERSVEDWAEQIRGSLRAAVKRWTLSDVPLACSLSGGLDSSALVGLLSEVGINRVKTYSVSFAGEGEAPWDESALARLVADKWSTDHHEIVLRPEELLKDLLTMVWYLEEPYAGGLPSWYVYREMAREVKVGLTGLGADELFGNYGRFSWYEENPIIRAAMSFHTRFAPIAKTMGVLASMITGPTKWVPEEIPWVGRGRLFARLSQLLARPFGEYYYANQWHLSDSQKRNFMVPLKGEACRDTSEYLQAIYDSVGAKDHRNGLAAVDFRTQLAEEFLFMTDSFSMAHSIEARVPFLDHTLVEQVFRIPPAIRTNAQDVKYLFRRAIGDLLPPQLLTAPKRGFSLPIELWLRRELRPLVERLLAPERLAKQGIFRKEFYAYFVEPHLAGKANYAWPIWAVLMYQLWHELYQERALSSPPSFSWKDLC